MSTSHRVSLAAAILFPLAALAAPPAGLDTTPYRAWIEQMKTAERGPFERVAWFCNDGTVLPPRPYACRDHGGGRQHGVWNQQARALREQGYYIANILGALDTKQALADDAERLKWVLLERFMLEQEDGWILRRARHYRGAFQSEGETRAARDLVGALLATPRYRGTHYLLTREAARLLPWRAERGALDKARALADTIAKADPGFTPLRNKIHGYPEKSDIEQVSRYRTHHASPETREPLESLEAALRATFEPPDLVPALRKLAGSQAAHQSTLLELADALQAAARPGTRLAVLGRVLTMLRDGLGDWSVGTGMQALDISLTAEQAAVTAALELLASSAGESRSWHLAGLRSNLAVLYGIGLLTARERDAALAGLAALAERPLLAGYRRLLDYLARVSSWSDARLQFHFRPQITRFAVLDPDVALFTQSRLRGSPLLLHGRLLEALAGDADRLAGVRHELLGETVGGGFRALNPGAARGPLLPLVSVTEPGVVAERPIVLAPETVADLPPVAGILTARAGNSLSHVQLLARNLGIPNVVVSAELIPRLESLTGERVVLLSSPEGVVRVLRDEARWDAVFPAAGEKPASIQVDLDKLELGQQRLLSLDALRADDSGRVVGPKAAKLGELKRHFPDRVSPGLALPFGVFRQALESAEGPGDRSLLEWMRDEYRRLDALDSPAVRDAQVQAFLEQVRVRIEGITLGEALRERLRERMNEVFGPQGGYGVFVRSDTNVEDLPGFTGAGLNLTIPNVVGFEPTLEAIKRVWASPFTDRAYAWRQALMDRPEHVYASVLLHQTVPADKSGVMVTADIRNNDPESYTIAANEGVGGGVEGQAAETLSVDPRTRKATLLASAAEPFKTILPPQGGVARAAASGAPTLLAPEEIAQLVAFGRSLPERYPSLLNAEGEPVPADVEFAFAAGKLFLIQIRPFLQSRRAQRNEVLQALDEQLKATGDRTVDLAASPEG